MKKLIYGSLFLAIVGIGIVGCKKETITPTSNQNSQKTIKRELNFDNVYRVASDGEMLVFESSEGYEKAISNLDSVHVVSFFSTISTLDFKSNLEVKKSNSTNDEYLDNLLNKDLAIQIGNYIYRVNVEDEKVFVLPAKFIEQYSDLVNENIKNSNIQIYSTEENVIELVENGSPSEKGWFCKDRKAKKKSQTSNTVTILSNPLVNMTIEAMYNKYGIYFTLKAVGEHHQDNSNLRYYFQIANSSWSQRCGSSVYNYSHPWRTKTSGSMSGGIYKEKFKFYQGMKQLKNYRFQVRFRCENWYQPSGVNPYTIYFTNYILIQDY